MRFVIRESHDRYWQEWHSKWLPLSMAQRFDDKEAAEKRAKELRGTIEEVEA